MDIIDIRRLFVKADNIMIGVLLVALVCFVIIYLMTGILISIANKKKEGKPTALGFIPIIQNYMLGKVAFNKFVGIIMLILPFLLGIMIRYIANDILKYICVIYLAICLICLIKLIIYIPRSSNNDEIKVSDNKEIDDMLTEKEVVPTITIEPVIESVPVTEVQSIPNTEVEEPTIKITDTGNEEEITIILDDNK